MLKSVYQHTVNTAITFDGTGVHSGDAARMVVKPAGANHGIVFIRTDITDKDNVIPARWDNVTETQLCTVLENKAGARVSTVEHILSACTAMGIDNAIIEINGAEIPIMDGSALPFVHAIEACGTMTQDAARRVLVIRKTVSVREGDKEVVLSPADGQYFGFEIAFDSPAIGHQKYTHQLKESSYKHDIAAARTFGFLHEVEQLRKMGLARGGTLENAVVIDGDRILNPDGWRFKNECVRHKVLDAIGDISLAGAQLIGHYHGVKAGHAMNNKALHTLFADKTAYEFITLNQPVAPARLRWQDTLQAQPVTA